MRIRNIVVALLIALPLLGGMLIGSVTDSRWSTEPDGRIACSQVGPAGPGIPGATAKCFYDFADTTDSGILDISRCALVQVAFNADEDGSGTGLAANPVLCDEATVSANHCKWTRYPDADLDGIEDTSGTFDGATAGKRGWVGMGDYLYISVTSNSNDARVIVSCKG